MATLIHDLIFETAQRTPHAPALSWQGEELSYAALAQSVREAAATLLTLGLQGGARVAVYLEKRPENVSAMFGAAAAGGVFVPVNPLLKPDQVAYILADCNVAILVTSCERLAQLGPALAACPDLRTVLLTGEAEAESSLGKVRVLPWTAVPTNVPAAGVPQPHAAIDMDMAAILYTSGSTGRPKGVVLSHRNMLAGALSVSGYLRNTPPELVM